MVPEHDQIIALLVEIPDFVFPVTRSEPELVITTTATQDVVAGPAMDQVVTTVSDQLVVAFIAKECVIALLAL